MRDDIASIDQVMMRLSEALKCPITISTKRRIGENGRPYHRIDYEKYGRHCVGRVYVDGATDDDTEVWGIYLPVHGV
jgi:hypothetical protein